MGLVGLLMAYYGGLWGILSGLTKSTDHPSRRRSLSLSLFLFLSFSPTRFRSESMEVFGAHDHRILQGAPYKGDP